MTDVKLLAALMRAQAVTTFISTLEGSDPSGAGDSPFSSYLQTLLSQADPSATLANESIQPRAAGSLTPFALLNRNQYSLPVHAVSGGTSTMSIPENLTSLIETSAAKYGVDDALVKGLIQQESGFNNQAVSPAGAVGLMQLMPGTARGLGVTDPFNPLQNVDAGVRHLKGLLDRYSGNVSLALAAYNAGAGNVDKYGGVPPFQETQAYVRNVQSLADRYRNL